MSGVLKLQVILAALDRASGPLKRITGGSAGAAKALRDTRARLKALDNTQRDISGFRALHAQLRTSQKGLTAAQDRVTELAGAMRAADTPTRALTREFNAAVKAAQKLERAHRGEAQQLQTVRARLQAAGVQTSQLQRHQRALRTESDQATRALQRHQRRLEQLGNAQRRMRGMHKAGMLAAGHGAAAVAAGTALKAPAGAPVAAFAQQETAATQLRAAMMGANGKAAPELAAMDAMAQRLGNRLPGTTADLYEMLTMLRRQGMSSKAILGGLGEATAYLGAQLRMPYTEAAEFSAKLQDATRTTEGDMMALADTIQRTFYLGVDADNMLQGFAKLSPALDTVRMRGLKGAQALAPLLVMADQAGMAGEQAGNAYRKVFQYAMDAEKVGKANGLLKGTGLKLDFTDGKGEFAGLDQLFVQLKKLERLSTQDRLAVIKKLFGDDAETLQVVSLLISKGAQGYTQVQGKMAAQAALQQRVNVQLGTLSNLWEAASGTFTNALASLGETVAPQLKSLTEWLGALSGRLQGWVQQNPGLAKGLFLIVGGIAAVLVVGGALALTLGTILMPFAGLQMALTTAAPLFGALGSGIAAVATRALPLLLTVMRTVGAAMLTNPVGLILTAIGVAAYLIYSNWSTIGPWFTGLWAGIKDAAAAVWDWLKRAFAWTPLGMIVANWSTILTFMSGLWDRVKLYVSGAWDVVRGIFSGDTTMIRTGLMKMWTAINAVLGGWPAKMLKAGMDMLNGLIQGIRSRIGAVTGVIGGVAGKAVGTLKALLGIRSPSRVFAAMGGDTMDGYRLGLTRGQSGPLATLDTFGTRLRRAGAGLALAGATLPVTATVLNAPALDTRPPIRGAAAASAGPAAGGTHVYQVTVQVQGLATPFDVEAAVHRALQAAEAQRGARTRSRLADYD